MEFIENEVSPLLFLIQKFIQKKNWYWPNIIAILKKRIVLKGQIPTCNQYTICRGQGKLIIGKQCEFGFKMGGRHRNGSVEIQPRYENSKIVISDKVSTNNNVFICAANYIEIGKDTLIGEGVTIMDHEAHGMDPKFRRDLGEIGEVKIGNNVWIGNNVIILKNTIIGDNTIVAAGAVVTGEFPSNVILGGVPAKVIKDL
ncbi:MAG TPA: acyltransferase [Hanamia sp.]|nr:acyltransferase [Hanamia sp.]